MPTSTVVNAGRHPATGGTGTITPSNPTDHGSTIASKNAVLFFGAAIASVLNYAFNPLLSRLVTVTQFGEIQALSSLAVQLVLFFTAIQVIVVNVAANESSSTARDQFVVALETVLAWVGLVAAGLLVAFAGPLANALQLSGRAPILVLAPLVAFGGIRTSRTGLLHADQDFAGFSVVEIVAAASRLVLAGGLAAIGFGTTGATTGLVLATPIAALVATRLARKRGVLRTSLKSLRLGSDALRSLRPHLGFALLSGWAALIITVLVNGDTLIVKALFTPAEAGLYAGVSVIGRTVFFLTASVAAVLLSSIKRSAAPRNNLRSLLHSTGLLLVPGVAGLVALSAAPDLAIRTLVGGDYIEYAHLLPIIAASMLAFSLVNLILTYHLALRDVGGAAAATAGIAATAFAIAVHHETVKAFTTSVLVGSIITLASCSAWTVAWNRRAMRAESPGQS